MQVALEAVAGAAPGIFDAALRRYYACIDALAAGRYSALEFSYICAYSG